MGRSVVITTPIPTADEMAKRMGMGKRRLAMIKRIARNIRETPVGTEAGAQASQGTARRAKAKG